MQVSRPNDEMASAYEPREVEARTRGSGSDRAGLVAEAPERGHDAANEEPGPQRPEQEAERETAPGRPPSLSGLHLNALCGAA